MPGGRLKGQNLGADIVSCLLSRDTREEGDMPREHGAEDYSEGPHVHLVVVLAEVQNLRGHEGHSADLHVREEAL